MLAEIVALAEREAVDLVLVAGDVFESAAPAPEAQRLAWATLLALRATGADVVVDRRQPRPRRVRSRRARRSSPAPASRCWAGRGRPDDGGVVELAARSTGERAARGAPAVRVAAGHRARRRAARARRGPDGGRLRRAHRRRRRPRSPPASRSRPSTWSSPTPPCAAGCSGAASATPRRSSSTRCRPRCSRRRRPTWPSATSIASSSCPRRRRSGTRARRSRSTSARRPTPSTCWSSKRRRARRPRCGPYRSCRLACCAPCGARSPSSPRRRRDLGDALLRVVVTEPARAGLADEVRHVLPNALEVRVERSDDERGPRAAGSPGADARTSCSRRTSPSWSIDDPRLQRLFADLLDVELSRGGG